MSYEFCIYFPRSLVSFTSRLGMNVLCEMDVLMLSVDARWDFFGDRIDMR